MSLNLSRLGPQPLGAMGVGATKVGRAPDHGEWRMACAGVGGEHQRRVCKLSAGSLHGRRDTQLFLPLLGQFTSSIISEHDARGASPVRRSTRSCCAKHDLADRLSQDPHHREDAKIYDEVGGFGQLLVFGFDYADNPKAWHHSLDFVPKEDDAQGEAPQAGEGQARSQ